MIELTDDLEGVESPEMRTPPSQLQRADSQSTIGGDEAEEELGEAHESFDQDELSSASTGSTHSTKQSKSQQHTPHKHNSGHLADAEFAGSFAVNEKASIIPDGDAEYRTRTDGYNSSGVIYDTGLPAAELRKREVKWLEIITNWRDIKKSKFKLAEVKELVRAGIPPSMRGRVWPVISGSAEFASTNPGVFEILRSLGENEWTEQIKVDLARTLPSHKMFKLINGDGQRDLMDVLQAFSHFNPVIGYCQGMGSVAAMFLLNLSAEEAFWLLHMSVQKYIKGYFEPSLKAVLVDAELFGDVLKLKYPKIHAHLEQLRVAPSIYITPWFMCLFSQTLSQEIVLHVIDILLNEGTYILYKVGYAILKIFKDEILRMDQSTDVMQLLLHPSADKAELLNSYTFMRIANAIVLYKYRSTINEVRHRRLVLEPPDNDGLPGSSS